MIQIRSVDLGTWIWFFHHDQVTSIKLLIYNNFCFLNFPKKFKMNIILIVGFEMGKICFREYVLLKL